MPKIETITNPRITPESQQSTKGNRSRPYAQNNLFNALKEADGWKEIFEVVKSNIFVNDQRKEALHCPG
jgi:hypothetical protein